MNKKQLKDFKDFVGFFMRRGKHGSMGVPKRPTKAELNKRFKIDKAKKGYVFREFD